MDDHATVVLPSEAPIDLASATLGLPGFVVLAGAEYGGELELLIETTQGLTACPRCGVVATLHDRKPRWVRDLPPARDAAEERIRQPSKAGGHMDVSDDTRDLP